jgi:hypothetical protein
VISIRRHGGIEIASASEVRGFTSLSGSETVISHEIFNFQIVEPPQREAWLRGTFAVQIHFPI